MKKTIDTMLEMVFHGFMACGSTASWLYIAYSLVEMVYNSHFKGYEYEASLIEWIGIYWVLIAGFLVSAAYFTKACKKIGSWLRSKKVEVAE